MIANLFRIPVQRRVERTALYRFWDIQGRLLYVGITNSPDLRWAQHAADKPWWERVHHKQVCAWYPSRSRAEAAERMAIMCERPLYNVIHNQGNPHRIRYRHNPVPTYVPTQSWQAYVPWKLAGFLIAFLALVAMTLTIGPFPVIGLVGVGMLGVGVMWPKRRQRRRRRRR